MAIESLSTVIPRWNAWSERAKQNPVLSAAAYPYPKKSPKFLGTIIQKYRPRKGAPTVGFQKWIDSINDRVSQQLFPTLKKINCVLPSIAYESVPSMLHGYCLAQIADFNTLITKSQDHRTPVYALTDVQLENVGTVLEGDQKKQSEFKDAFSNLADFIIKLMSFDDTA